MSNTSVIDFCDHVLLCGIGWSRKFVATRKFVNIKGYFSKYFHFFCSQFLGSNKPEMRVGYFL
jgi:hypothetical protein